MKDKIKLMAQFLWDNADYIAEQLEMSDKYRSISVEFTSCKPRSVARQRTMLSIYDERCYPRYLKGTKIHIDAFKALCTTMNIEVGETPELEPQAIRESLAGSKYDKLAKSMFATTYAQLNNEDQITIADLYAEKEE